jgi:hypothetical protein
VPDEEAVEPDVAGVLATVAVPELPLAELDVVVGVLELCVAPEDDEPELELLPDEELPEDELPEEEPPPPPDFVPEPPSGSVYC